MDVRAQGKALFRSKLRENSQKREKHIDSPLVRYNQDDQPVCRVCNVTLKSESLWPAHQASRKHHEAIENVKAAAASRQSTSNNSHLQKQQNLRAPQVLSTLPAGFFDSQDAKRQKTEHVNKGSGLACGSSSESKEMDQIKPTVNLVNSSKYMGGYDVMEVKSVLPGSFADKGTDDGHSRLQSQVLRDRNNLEAKKPQGALPSNFFDKIDTNVDSQAKQFSKELEKTDVVQLKPVKGALPAGFFDNKDADLRARGIEPVKVDIGDAYKEFEKEIQEDLQGVDDRLEEEEIDAAEVREGIESIEQKAYRERVEMVKKKLIEAKESRLARLQRSPEFKGKDSSESSTDESDADEDFAVDWRAKRL